MKEPVNATGFVLKAEPQGEFDKRLVILTGEYGKITVFARGARKPTSSYLAACNPFVCARFEMYEGRSAYNLSKAEKAEYFTELAGKDPGVYYGFYFLDLCSFYGQENLEAREMVELLYVSLRAILKGKVSLKLIRRIFECRIMAINGDFAVPDHLKNDAAKYAFEFVMSCPLSRLYSFELSRDAFDEFSKNVSYRIHALCGDRLKSLSVLRMIDEQGQ